MARPALTTIVSQTAGWDAFVSGNFSKLASAPIPIYESASLTEANLQATFPAAAHDRCMVWVNHSTLGYVLYQSDGAAWRFFDPRKTAEKAVTGGVTLTSADGRVVKASGTLPYTLTLPLASTMKGEIMRFKTLVTGTLTIARQSTDTIDGSATSQTIVTQFGALLLRANEARNNWDILSRYLT